MLTDTQGRRTDFRNTVLVMTSNLGSQHFRLQGRLGFLPEEGADREEVERMVLAEARRTFAPEFLNRLDGTLVFHPLDGNSLTAITRQLLDQTGSGCLLWGCPSRWRREQSGFWPGQEGTGTMEPGRCGAPLRPR